jgi:hypothetical protein
MRMRGPTPHIGKGRSGSSRIADTQSALCGQRLSPEAELRPAAGIQGRKISIETA